MKKTLIIFLSILLAFTALNFIGCGSKEKASDSVKKYSVKFYVNQEMILEKEVEKGKKTTPPTYSSYNSQLGRITVEGWYLDDTFSQLFNFETTTVNQDLILYAKLKQENPYLTKEEFLNKLEENSKTAQIFANVTSLRGSVNSTTFETPEGGFSLVNGILTINEREIRVRYDKLYFSEFLESDLEFVNQKFLYKTSENCIDVVLEYIKNGRDYKEHFVINSDNYVTEIAFIDRTDTSSIIRFYTLSSIIYGK